MRRSLSCVRFPLFLFRFLLSSLRFFNVLFLALDANCFRFLMSNVRFFHVFLGCCCRMFFFTVRGGFAVCLSFRIPFTAVLPPSRRGPRCEEEEDRQLRRRRLHPREVWSLQRFPKKGKTN